MGSLLLGPWGLVHGDWSVSRSLGTSHSVGFVEGLVVHFKPGCWTLCLLSVEDFFREQGWGREESLPACLLQVIL